MRIALLTSLLMLGAGLAAAAPASAPQAAAASRTARRRRRPAPTLTPAQVRRRDAGRPAHAAARERAARGDRARQLGRHRGRIAVVSGRIARGTRRPHRPHATRQRHDVRRQPPVSARRAPATDRARGRHARMSSRWPTSRASARPCRRQRSNSPCVSRPIAMERGQPRCDLARSGARRDRTRAARPAAHSGVALGMRKLYETAFSGHPYHWPAGGARGRPVHASRSRTRAPGGAIATVRTARGW